MVKLKPMTNRRDRDYARKFGVDKYPAVLLLDWQAKRKLAEIGDVTPQELAAKLAEVRKSVGR